MYVLCGRGDELGHTGSMAEEGGAYEPEELGTRLLALSGRYSSEELRADSGAFCADFCELVEEFASRWQVPLPQLRILEIAFRYFSRASTFFTSNCDHVLHTLSSLALSVFELLLFFDQKDFHQEPLKHFTVTFQECHLVLARHQNVHLLQVERLVQGDGPWADSVLQAILSESSLPQNEVDGCINAELPVFFELRVRYLLSCERVSEAMALTRCCARHPMAGRHLFFLQVYLTWLYKTSQHDRLHKEVDDVNSKDAVHIICSLECEEQDDLLLGLSRAFLSQQLRRGDVYYLCDLVFIWSKLHSRLDTSEQALLEESQQLMLCATNVNSIFPFIRAILQELGDDGKQFCVELCTNALESCLPCDVVTKSLIYKTIAGLLPNDLEVCRACALLVFFQERTVEAYKRVYLLYMHPDQEYHVECSPIGNHVRFEMLQVLKKDLYFDPEFWNLIALRTNCLKLMSEKVVSAALEEIMEDKWISNYSTKEPSSRSSTCRRGKKRALQAAAKKRHQRNDSDIASKRLKVGPGKTQLKDDHAVKTKGTQGLRPLKDKSSEPLRRSFWRLDRIQDNVTIRYGEHRRITRLSEKNPPKRRIRKPRWLLEDSAALKKNNVSPDIKKHELRHQQHHRSSDMKRPETGQIRNNAKHKAPVNSHLGGRQINKHQREFSLDYDEPAQPPQIILELSLPDNELMGTFTEESGNRQRGFPQVLFYKPTVKLPATSQPAKIVHRKEVVLRARDAAMFVKQLHCYARRQKGKGHGLNVHGSVSTITRSSVQGSPPKDAQRRRCEKPEGKGASRTLAEVLEKVHPVSRKTSAARESADAPQTPAGAKVTKSPVSDKVPQPASKGKVLRNFSSARDMSVVEMKATTASQTSEEADRTETPVLDKIMQAQTASARELCEEPAVEMKVTIASQTSSAAKVPQSPGVGICKAQSGEDLSKITASAEITTADNNQSTVNDETQPVSDTANNSNTADADLLPLQTQDVVLRDDEKELMSLSSLAEKIPVAKADTSEVLNTVCNNIAEVDLHPPCERDTIPTGNMVTLSKASEPRAIYSPPDQDAVNDISALTLVTEMVTELAPEALARDLENDKQRAPENSASEASTVKTVKSKTKVPHKIRSTSSCSVSAQEASTVSDVQLNKGTTATQDIDSDASENSEPETEESKLEFSCTFCDKFFKGSRVVSHAMFHYRRDECMFCRTMFKDDLLAMMHLSAHIEKLKKSKDQENRVSETKGISTPKTSAKDNTTNMSSARRGRGRPRKSDVVPESEGLQDPRRPESRKLRSKDKSADEKPSQEKTQNTSKHLNSETPVHKVNGHIGKKKELGHVGKKKELGHVGKKKEIVTERRDLEAEQPLPQQDKSQERTSNESENHELSENEDKKMKTESLPFLKATTKERNVEPQEKVCCPVDGCVWFKDLSKNHVALLYHALDDHHGELKPLELAFRVGNSRCSICMRVLFSFKHFQHHVERHRVSPRHPCLHEGCPARFKSGMEMRRHARRHNPLQAVCCLPGCSQLFICLWALNLHEREHYTSKPTKPHRMTSEETGDKHNNTAVGKKQQDNEPKDATALNKTLSLKAACKLRRRATHKSSSRKHMKAPLSSDRDLKERNETEDSNVLKNLSNKDTSAQPTVPNLRLRQTLRKVSNTTMAARKVISSSLLKRNNKARHKFKKNQVKVNADVPKRRGRPPKLKKPVHDENTSTGQNSETVIEKTALQTDPKNPAQLSSPSPKAAVASDVSDGTKEQEVNKTTKTSVNESKCKKSVTKQIKKSHVSSNPSISRTSADKTHKSTTDQVKKVHKAKKRSSLESGCQSAASNSSESKKRKVTKSKVDTKTKSALKKTTKVISAVQQVEAKAVVVDEDGKAKTENKDSTDDCTGESVPAVASNDLANAPSTTSGETNKEKSTKPHLTKKERPKENKTETASSGSDEVKKNQKDVNKKTDKKTVKEKRPRKDPSKTPAVKKKSKSVVQPEDGAKAAALEKSDQNEEGKVKDPTLSSSGSSAPADTSSSNEKTSPTATEENTQKVTTQKKLKKNSDPNKESKKRKNIHKEGHTKSVKKSAKTSKTEVKPYTEVKATAKESSVGKEGAASVETPQCPISSSGYSVINRKAPGQVVKSSVCKDTLALYGKKPYMRLPPTAYLDEKYITMPKRRKDVSPSETSQRCPPPGLASVTAAQQRQRCANCFATFTTAEDLQGHLQQQKCSNLFGFDSDDEGNS